MTKLAISKVQKFEKCSFFFVLSFFEKGSTVVTKNTRNSWTRNCTTSRDISASFYNESPPLDFIRMTLFSAYTVRPIELKQQSHLAIYFNFKNGKTLVTILVYLPGQKECKMRISIFLDQFLFLISKFMFIYYDLLRKNWFPYYKHMLWYLRLYSIKKRIFRNCSILYGYHLFFL